EKLEGRREKAGTRWRWPSSFRFGNRWHASVRSSLLPSAFLLLPSAFFLGQGSLQSPHHRRRDRMCGRGVGMQIAAEPPPVLKFHEHVRQAFVIENPTPQRSLELVLAIELRHQNQRRRAACLRERDSRQKDFARGRDAAVHG